MGDRRVEDLPPNFNGDKWITYSRGVNESTSYIRPYIERSSQDRRRFDKLAEARNMIPLPILDNLLHSTGTGNPCASSQEAKVIHILIEMLEKRE